MTNSIYQHKTLKALEVFKGIYTSENYAAYNRECRNQLNLQNQNQ
jgi:hypothetical protein